MSQKNDIIDELKAALKALKDDAAAALDGWLDFAHRRFLGLDAGLPLDLAALKAACRDPWLAGQADPGADTSRLVDWVRAHRAAEDRLSPESEWREWLRRLQEGHVLSRVEQSVSVFAVVTAPFVVPRSAVELALEYELAPVGDLVDTLDRLDLMSGQDRRACRAHRVIRREYDQPARFFEDLLADLTELPGLERLTRPELDRFWERGEIGHELKVALASNHSIDRTGGLQLASGGPRRLRLEPSARLRTTVARLVFTGDDPDLWQQRWERMAWLLAPLAPPDVLVDSMRIQEAAIDRPMKAWAAGRRKGFLTAITELAEGGGLWVHTHEALSAAGSDLAPFRELLELGPQKGADWIERQLVQPAFVWALTAGFGHLAARDDDRWWADTVACLASGGHRLWLTSRYTTELYTTELLRPFAARLAAHPEVFAEPAARANDSAIGCLWSTFGLAEACLANPDLYQHFAEKDELRHMTVSAELAAKHPDGWLRHARNRFERSGVFQDAGVRTDAAFAWYREILPRASDDRQRNEVLDALAPALSNEEIAVLVNEYYPDASSGHPDHRLFRRFTDFSVVAGLLDSAHPDVVDCAAARLLDITLPSVEGEEGPPDPEVWSQFMEVCRSYPDVFAEQQLGGPGDDPARWALLWEHASRESSRVSVAGSLLRLIRDGDREEAGAVATDLFTRDPEPFRLAAARWYSDGSQPLCLGLERVGGALLKLVPGLSLSHLRQSTWLSGSREALERGPLDEAFRHFPETFAELEDKEKLKLLPYVSDRSLVVLGPALAAMLEKRKNKTLSATAAAMLSERRPEALKDSGLLASRSPSLRYTLNRGLALSRFDEVAELLESRLDDKANDEYVRGLMLDRLESSGVDVRDRDPRAGLGRADLLAEAEKVKVPKAVSRVWSASLAAAFADLGEPIGLLALLKLHEGGGERLPRAARQIIEELSAARRQDLAVEAVGTWVGEKGTDKVAWLMQLVPVYGEERCADALTRAVKGWNKQRKAKANEATRWMARIPGDYGLSQIKTIYENTKYSDSIVRTARVALEAVAEGRGMDFRDLMDQLVPDFGMTSEGLRLDVGPSHYVVKVLPDLSLRVIDESGKAAKTLPRARAGEDPDLRGVAENRFKALRKRLKPLARAQAKKLRVAVGSAKAWRTDVWRRLYLEHPVLRLLGQGVLWTGLDEKGDAWRRFRPSEDGSLIDVKDEEVDLAGVVAVRIAHPVELEAEVRAAWKAHFDDYEIESPIDQWSLSVTLPGADEIEEGTRITRKRGFVVPRASFGSLLEQFGYAPGGAGDGGRIHEHAWVLHDGTLVQLAHTAMSAWFDDTEEVAIDHFSVWGPAPPDDGRREPLEVSRLPRPLLASLVQQADELAARSGGFDPGWRSRY